MTFSNLNVGFNAGIALRIMPMIAAVIFSDPLFAQTSDPNTNSVAPPSKASWRIEPTLAVRETYTDNVSLARGDAAKSDFITEISPGFTIKNQGGRSKVDLEYSLNNLFYARDNDRNTLNHQLRALGEFEFIEDLLYLDSRANISQQAVSAFGPIGSNSSTTNNNQTLRTYSVSPYLRKHFGRTATAEARYIFSQQSSNGGGASLSDNTGNGVLLKLDSGPAFYDWGWGAAYNRDQINYEKAPDTTFESISGNLRYRLNPRLFATASLGYDRNDYFTTGKVPEGNFWTLGADWRPLKRTVLTASAGRRYFGTTYAFGFQHATRRTAWDISYQQNLTTSQSQFNRPTGGTIRQVEELNLRANDPTISDAALQSKLNERLQTYISAGINPDSAAGINFQTNTAFVEKKWQGLLTVNLPKSQLSFRAFNSVKDASTLNTVNFLTASGDFALSQIIKEAGISASWAYHLSARDDANLGLDLSRFRLVDIGRTDNLTALNLGISRKLSHTAHGTLGYRFSRRESNFDVNSYDENAFFGTLNLTF